MARWIGLRVLFLLVLWGSCCPLAFPQPQGTLSAQVIGERRSRMPLVRVRRNGHLNHLYTFDHTPLGCRTPVILIPGRAEEFQHSSWWKKFRKMSRNYPGFEEHYKLYAFIYDSGGLLSRQSEDFTREMLLYFPDFSEAGNHQLVLVSYSLGGMIAGDSMRENQAVFDQVHTLFAVAVPFHGSPMFDTEWFSKYMRPPNRSPIRKFWDRTVYHLYLFGKDNLKEGLNWNNFDGSKPMYNGGELQGHMLLSRIDDYQEHPQTRALKAKTIIYASYLQNEFTHPREFTLRDLPRYITRTPLILPKAVVGSVLPLYGKSVHSVFIYMNRQLALLPTYSAEKPEGEANHLYRYNDGVFPLSSMLYLPARSQPYHEDFDDLVKAIDVKMARIFLNIDHMHIGEYALHQSRLRTADLLRPGAGERTPNEWLLYDLDHLADEVGDPACPAGKALLE